MEAPQLDAVTLTQRLRGHDQSQEYWLHLETASPLEKYPAKQHARRVQEELGVENGLIYLPGTRAHNNEDSDMPAAFRQRRYFYYLSGCNEPDCHLAYDIQRDTLALFIPKINPSRVIWNGRGSTPSEALDKYDIDEVYFVDELQDFLQDWFKFCKGQLYILHTSQTPLIPGLHESIDSTSLQPAMNLARVVKDDHEIMLIQKANDISSRAHREVLASILDFTNEAQVEGLFLNVCISEQAKTQAYDPIAASGPNAGTLHYDANNEDFGDRQLMCLDAGCEYELYASDITRTFPLSPEWPSKETENIYNLVQRMQDACIERLAPGVRYLDLHILAHQIAIDGLLELGILHNGTREEIYKAGTSRAFFPHGLGHHVGLEVHDVGQGDLMSMSNPLYERAPSIYPENHHIPVYDGKVCLAPTDPQSGHLEEGMVVTVEPGIYFSAYALLHFYLPSPIHSRYINSEVVKRYMPVGGVRIEDDILITSRGFRNLTTAPKGQAMFEIIRNGKKSNPRSPRSAINQSADTEPKDVEPEEPLLRAPGISKRTRQPIPKPLAKAATMPANLEAARESIDFEPFAGPSLFANFKRSTTTEENVQRWQEAQQTRKRSPKGSPRSSLKVESQVPICGDTSPGTRHSYINFSSELSTQEADYNRPSSNPKPACSKCTVLTQTLDRLRQNLNLSEPTSPIQDLDKTGRIQPITARKNPRFEHRPLATTPSAVLDHHNAESRLIGRMGKGEMPNSFQSPLRQAGSTHPLKTNLCKNVCPDFPPAVSKMIQNRGVPEMGSECAPKLNFHPIQALNRQAPNARNQHQFSDQLIVRPLSIDPSATGLPPRHYTIPRQPVSRPSLPVLPSELSSSLPTAPAPFFPNDNAQSRNQRNPFPTIHFRPTGQCRSSNQSTSQCTHRTALGPCAQCIQGSRLQSSNDARTWLQVHDGSSNDLGGGLGKLGIGSETEMNVHSLRK